LPYIGWPLQTIISYIQQPERTIWLAFGATAHQHELCDGDVTSGLTDDVTIDGDLGNGSWTDGHFRVTSDVMGQDVTSG